MRIGVKAVPGASRPGIVGWLGDDLKIRVQAPPEDGRANLELCRILAAEVGLAPSAVTIVSGHAARRKVIALDAGESIFEKLPPRPKGTSLPLPEAR
jgi:hypothetical protein